MKMKATKAKRTKATEALPDYVFSTSWEVCNKVGGIYTVLSTQAETLQKRLPDRVVYLGPDFGDKATAFRESSRLHPAWRRAIEAEGIGVRIGRWMVPGRPLAILVRWDSLLPQRNAIYGRMWEDYGVDSLHAYGDYDEACLSSYAMGKAIEAIVRTEQPKVRRRMDVVVQAHEWMSGFALLYIKKHLPEAATVFTTHATSIGRSITTNNKPLYDYFEGYHGDQMARELHMEAKHSVEKHAALEADVMTTVSTLTDRECRQFLGRGSDVILPNGFEPDFVPQGQAFTTTRRRARRRLTEVAGALLGMRFDDNDVTIVSTSGRNDFRCKGFDMFVHAMQMVQQQRPEKPVLAFIAVPCWTKEPRQDLRERLDRMAAGSAGLTAPQTSLPDPVVTHWLNNMDNDRILATLRACQVKTGTAETLHVILIPTYLDGHDGIVDLTYYDFLTACDLCLYPSYYEPWGYTPLESAAFGIPCLTTDLSGFGQWVNSVLGYEGRIEDGVAVVHRTDGNYEDASQQMAGEVWHYLHLGPTQKQRAAGHARALATRATWKNFIQNYYHAYALALSRGHERNRQ